MDGVVPLLLAALQNVGEMLTDSRLTDGAHILPHMVGTVLFHLCADRCAHHVAGLQFVGKAVPVFIQQQRTLPANRFRNQKATAFSVAVQSRGVDLDIVQVLTGNAVAQGHGDGIPRDVGEVGGVFIQPADAAAGQHHRPCPDSSRFAVRAGSNDTAAGRGIGEEIQQSRMLAQFDVLAAQDLVQQGLGDLVAGNILMEQNARAGVRSLPGKAQSPVVIPRKADAAAHQIPDDRVGGTNHQVYCGGVVLVMACPHRIIKKGAVVCLAMLHTNAALRKEGVALVRFLLCKQKNAVPRRQIQGAVKARSAGADDDYVKIVIHISHFHVVSSVSSVIPTLTV